MCKLAEVLTTLMYMNVFALDEVLYVNVCILSIYIYVHLENNALHLCFVYARFYSEQTKDNIGIQRK